MPRELSSKKKHKKRHKKEKMRKHKKEKKHKTKSKTYESESSSSSDSEEKKIKIKNINKDELVQSEWGFLDAVLSNSNVKDKTVKENKRDILDKPGQSCRELNPYWKDGGCGLPPNNQAKSFDTKPSCSSNYLNLNYNKNNDVEKTKPRFMKPEENKHFESYKNTYQRNWKKKDLKANELESSFEKIKTTNIEIEANTTVTNDDLNTLAAKLVKAEIMGNTSLINKLKAELEAAKKIKQDKAPEEKQKEIVLLANKSFRKLSPDNQQNMSLKRQKVATHLSNERIRYFVDDDKYSLKNLFEKEKRGEGNDDDDDVYITSKLKGRAADELDDAFLEAASTQKFLQKNEDRKNQKSKKDAILKYKTLEGCLWCLDNRIQTKHLIVSTGSKCYLSLPEVESLNEGHCIIVPLQHEHSMLHLDEDVWDEVKTYQRALTKMFLEKNQDVIFLENARGFKYFPHCYIQCIPMHKEIGDLAPIYFQKAISESDSEWCSNKKVIDFRQKDLRKSIPKGLPYFAVSFGNEGGFAHVIEDEFLFRKNFGEEVLGGMMDIDQRKWRKPQKENFTTQRKKTFDFLKMWKKFEFNDNSSNSSSNDTD